MTTVLDSLTDDLEDCVDDPDLFNDLFLCDPDDPTPFWSRQVEMSRSVVDYRTTCIYSGNSIGKDFWVGRLVHWWLYTRPDSLVIVTGPTQTLIGTVTWKEIRRAIRRSPVPFSAMVSAGAKNSPMQVVVEGGWQALGYSTTNVERQSGQHAEHLLVIVEEASGVEDEIWDAIESLGYERLICIGNPIRAEGRFVDLIRQAERDRNDRIPARLAVNAIQIPSTDSPHASLEKSPFGLADATWLDSVKRRYGEHSLWYKSHVLAIIPAVSADILIPESWLEFAYRQLRPQCGLDHPIHLTRRLSCDLGEGVGRDSTCIIVRDDFSVLECVLSPSVGLPEAAALIERLGRKWKIPPERMSYDKLGIGRNFPNHLAKYRASWVSGSPSLSNVRPYGGSSTPMNRDFVNLRSEAAWKLRNRLDVNHVPDIRTPYAVQVPFSFAAGSYLERLREELRPLTYSLVGHQTKLLDKDDWTEILGHSPDVADALLQSFAFT